MPRAHDSPTSGSCLPFLGLPPHKVVAHVAIPNVGLIIASIATVVESTYRVRGTRVVMLAVYQYMEATNRTGVMYSSLPSVPTPLSSEDPCIHRHLQIDNCKPAFHTDLQLQYSCDVRIQ